MNRTLINVLSSLTAHIGEKVLNKFNFALAIRLHGVLYPTNNTLIRLNITHARFRAYVLWHYSIAIGIIEASIAASKT